MDAFEANVSRGTLGSKEASHSWEAHLTGVTRLAFGSWLSLVSRKPCATFCPSLSRGT